MNFIERHKSLDRLFDLVVAVDSDDWTIGFVELGANEPNEWQWHTHGDILTLQYGGTPESATRAFVDDIVASKRVIVISRVDGKIRCIWVTDDPDEDELRYAENNETIEKRFWNGLLYVGASAKQ